MIRPPPISTRTDTLFPSPTLVRSLCAVHKDHAFQASSPKLKAALRGGFFFRHPLPWMARHTIGDSLLGKLLICRSACGPARPAIATTARGPAIGRAAWRERVCQYE